VVLIFIYPGVTKKTKINAHELEALRFFFTRSEHTQNTHYRQGAPARPASINSWQLGGRTSAAAEMFDERTSRYRQVRLVVNGQVLLSDTLYTRKMMRAHESESAREHMRARARARARENELLDKDRETERESSPAYMLACIHTYIHTCTHTYTHTCMHACIHTYIHTYMRRTKNTNRGLLAERK
jgi:hypothetical protein